MKKAFLFLLAAGTLMLCSCKKNPAEQYEGTYKIDAKGSYSLSKAKATDAFTTTESGSLTIRLSGEHGDVVVTGDVYNTTGHVDADGILHLDAEQHAQAGVGAGLSLFGYPIASVDVNTTLNHGEITINDNGTMTWNSNGTGSASIYALGLQFDVATSVQYTNTAVQQ